MVASHHLVELRWLGLAMKKRKEKFTLGPKTCQNASLGPQKWWMLWVWAVVARWWMVVVLTVVSLH